MFHGRPFISFHSLRGKKGAFFASIGYYFSGLIPLDTFSILQYFLVLTEKAESFRGDDDRDLNQILEMTWLFGQMLKGATCPNL